MCEKRPTYTKKRPRNKTENLMSGLEQLRETYRPIHKPNRDLKCVTTDQHVPKKDLESRPRSLCLDLNNHERPTHTQRDLSICPKFRKETYNVSTRPAYTKKNLEEKLRPWPLDLSNCEVLSDVYIYVHVYVYVYVYVYV